MTLKAIFGKIGLSHCDRCQILRYESSLFQLKDKPAVLGPANLPFEICLETRNGDEWFAYNTTITGLEVKGNFFDLYGINVSSLANIFV